MGEAGFVRFGHDGGVCGGTGRRVKGAGGTCIIGDPPRFPLAYHVLTTSLLRLAGRPMACAEKALAALQAPNGDAAWSGRTYLQ